jgi:PKD repeat protein
VTALARRSRAFPRAWIVLLACGLAGLAVGLGGPGPGEGRLLAGAQSTLAPSSCGPAISMTADPVTGPAPLLVQFRAVDLAGRATQYDWAFGDGSYFQGPAAEASALSHLYVAVGAFRAQLLVFGPWGLATCDQNISVSGAGLAVRISATPSSGFAPLTVHLSGFASGGTGTFPRFDWRFGDGGAGTGPDLNYTYTSPGQYAVRLTVSDTLGETAMSTFWLNVTAVAPSSAPPSRGPFFWPSSNSVYLWLLAPLGAGLALLTFREGSRVRRRRLGRASRDPAVPNGAQFEPPRPSTSAPISMGPEPNPPVLVGSPHIPAERIRLSRRIVVHLALQGSLPLDGTVPSTFTQRGIAQALQVRQGELSNALRRLVTGRVLVEELRHVHDSTRRLKVYRLTGTGEAIARQLRPIVRKTFEERRGGPPVR